MYTPKVIIQNVPKRNVFFKLSFFGSSFKKIPQKLKKLPKLFTDKLTSCNLIIVFVSAFRVKSFFTFKDKLPKMFTRIVVVAAMLPIMVIPNRILKSYFVKI